MSELDATTVIRLVLWAIAGSAFLLTIAAFVIVVISAASLSSAKNYGIRKREACGNEYQEHETARHELFQAYNEKIKYLMKTAMGFVLYALAAPLAYSTIANIRSSQSAWKTRKNWWLVVISWVTLAIVVTYYAMFISKDVTSNKLSKYFESKALKVTGQVDTYSKGTIAVAATLSGSMLALIAVSLYIAGQTSSVPVHSSAKAIAIAYGVVTLFAAAVFILVNANRKDLEAGLLTRYNIARNELQTAVTSLLGKSDVFKTSMMINVKRSEPLHLGDPDIVNMTDSYKYVEHRPGKDTFTQSESIPAKQLKLLIQPYLESADIDFQTKVALLELTQRMYAANVSDDFLFDVTTVNATIDQLFKDPSNGTRKNEVITALQNMTGKITFEKLLRMIREANKQRKDDTELNEKNLIAQDLRILVSSKITNTVDNKISYKALYPLIKGYPISSQMDQSIKDRLQSLMMFIVHNSTYGDNVQVNLDSISYYLDTTNTVPFDIATALHGKVSRPVPDTDVAKYQMAMRNIRQLESRAINTANRFSTYVTVVGGFLLFVVLYILMRIGMTFNPDLTVMITGGGMLLTIFAITWYAWFYVKLML